MLSIRESTAHPDPALSLVISPLCCCPSQVSRTSRRRVWHNRASFTSCPGGSTYLAQADGVVESLCPRVEVHCLFYLILALVLPGKVVGCSPVSSLVGYFSRLEGPRTLRSYLYPAASIHPNRPTPTGCTNTVSKIFYFCVYVFENMNEVPMEARRRHRCPGLEFTGGYELSHMGAGNSALVLYKSTLNC